MINKNKKWLVFIVVIVLLFLPVVNATELQQVETNGTIGFTGVYEPIGKPDPTPSESIERLPITEMVKPGGKLPQTNDNESSRLLWLGILIINFVFLLWKRKNKQIKN